MAKSRGIGGGAVARKIRNLPRAPNDAKPGRRNRYVFLAGEVPAQPYRQQI